MTRADAGTRAANILMALTYAIAVLGIGLAFSALGDPEPDLALAALLAVGAGGLLSFARHALFHRADAQRIGWTSEGANPFQIEVGLANLAWGLYAVLAVALDWGMAAIASSFLISGLYFVAVTVFIIVGRDVGTRRIGPLIGIGSWGVIMVVLGALGMAAR